MTVSTHDLTVRPIAGPDELELFCRLPYSLNAELAGDLAERRRRPEWMWVALRGDTLLARVAWWSRPDGARPLMMDVFDLADTGTDAPGDIMDVGVRLLRTATAAVFPAGAGLPEYGRYIPPDWQDDPAARRIVEDRVAALQRTGARLLVERLRLQWLPGTPVTPPTGRLSFRPVRSRTELVALMADVLDGTLDAHSRQELTRMPAAQAAAEQYDDELASYRSPREWWQVAVLPDGDPVGFVIPAHNGYNPIIAYLGVLPAHRGRGYIDEILAEGTRILAGQGVPRIRAATDLGNRPMAAAFGRAGYDSIEHEINMTWT